MRTKIDSDLIRNYALTQTWEAASRKYQEVYIKAINDFNTNSFNLGRS